MEVAILSCASQTIPPISSGSQSLALDNGSKHAVYQRAIVRNRRATPASGSILFNQGHMRIGQRADDLLPVLIRNRKVFHHIKRCILVIILKNAHHIFHSHFLIGLYAERIIFCIGIQL